MDVKKGTFPQYYAAEVQTTFTNYDDIVSDYARNYNYMMAREMGTHYGYT